MPFDFVCLAFNVLNHANRKFAELLLWHFRPRFIVRLRLHEIARSFSQFDNFISHARFEARI